MATLTRKKLLKLIGKELEYCATVGRLGTNDGILLLDVCHKGKFVTDHCWVSTNRTIETFEKGSRVIFNATATTYKDTQGNRKHGLDKCYDYRLDNEVRKILEHDKQHSIKRQRK